MKARRWENTWTLYELRPGVRPVYWSHYLDRPAPDLSDVVAERLPDALHLLQIWEPLHTKAPSPARCQPYCCYARTVIFYHRPYIPRGPYPWKANGRWHWEKNGRTFAIFDQIETRLCCDDVIEFDGERFEIGGGHVRWHHRRWWMHLWGRRRQARANAA